MSHRSHKPLRTVSAFLAPPVRTRVGLYSLYQLICTRASAKATDSVAPTVHRSHDTEQIGMSAYCKRQPNAQPA